MYLLVSRFFLIVYFDCFCLNYSYLFPTLQHLAAKYETTIANICLANEDLAMIR